MKEIAKLPIFWLTPVTAKCIWRQPGKRNLRPNKFGRYKCCYPVDYKGNAAPPPSESLSRP